MKSNSFLSHAFSDTRSLRVSYADCSVCKSGYSPSLAYTCTRCSEPRQRGLVVIVAVATMLAVCGLGALSAYLLSTNVGDGAKTCIHHGMFRVVPLQGLKNVIIVWQVLTQVSCATGTSSGSEISSPFAYSTHLSISNI